MSLVEIENLSISFDGRPAVSGLSLTVGKGERFGIIGESGSGKSLTAMAITGLLPDNAAVAGSLRYDGEALPKDEKAMARLRGQRIGMVFQEPMTALNPLMRVGAQIEEAVLLADGPRDGRSNVEALLVEVGLEAAHARRYPHQLSGGQRQRVMIAMALASAPDLLIADEPTSALDLITQRVVLDLISDICARRKMTLIFISHDMRAVAALCDRVAVLRGGLLVETGTVEETMGQPRDAYTAQLVAATRMAPRQRMARPAGATLLAVKDLTRAFSHRRLFRKDPNPLLAVDSVNFSVTAGECLALVGPSGCGKTTLARMIVGLDTATSGEMIFEGARCRGSDLPPLYRADMSLVFQDPFGSFNPRLTIAQSLEEPLALIPGLDADARELRVVDAVESVGLHRTMLSRYPHEFSGGQRQRLAIARALVTRPKLVVLDEPVSALDVSVRGDVLRLLAQLQEQFGLTYIIISHDLDMVAAMSDRVLVMEKGRIVEEGAPMRLFEAPQHKLTRDLIAARLPDVTAA
jgi:peptide/nickel transport system ATP-binding protein